jgi:hypothetical protein
MGLTQIIMRIPIPNKEDQTSDQHSPATYEVGRVHIFSIPQGLRTTPELRNPKVREQFEME